MYLTNSLKNPFLLNSHLVAPDGGENKIGIYRQLIEESYPAGSYYWYYIVYISAANQT